MDELFDQTIILRKKYNDKEHKKEQIRKGEFTIEKKKNQTNSYKFDEDDGNYKHKEVDKKLSTIIQKARVNKNFTQKQLAQKMNIQIGQLNDYESGKKNPDNNILAKLERILKVKLRGEKSKIGSPL